ncbi:hypothetical protein [Brevibacillus centrosporus]|uniref:hypothetical protein n=1 Tax=Brevibacillus centrosporus TaxID=54910 RepID=UPI003B0230F7
MSTVSKDFVCKVTGQLYEAGDQYDGERTKELQRLGYVESEEFNGSEWPKHIGGGNFELSNGDKVKGKDAAIAAQAEIDESDE